MRFTFCAAGLGALAVLAMASCSSEGGTGASTATTIKISAPEFVTIPPITDATTTTAAAAPGDGGATVGTIATAQDYTVQAGDALLLIASKHCLDGMAGAESIAAFNEWSDGTSHGLNAGDVIKIPPGACVTGGSLEPVVTDAPASEPVTQDTATGGSTAASTAESTPTSTDSSAGGTYTVKAGDTLYGIASKVGTTAEAIRVANGWDSVDHLIYPGLEIKLPAKSG